MRAAAAASGSNVAAGPSRNGIPAKPVKVVLCQPFTQNGICERENNCQFAHGLQELHFYRAKQVSWYYLRTDRLYNNLILSGSKL